MATVATVATAVRVPARLARPALARPVQAVAALAGQVPPEAVREPARTATAVRVRVVAALAGQVPPEAVREPARTATAVLVPAVPVPAR